MNFIHKSIAERVVRSVIEYDKNLLQKGNSLEILSVEGNFENVEFFLDGPSALAAGYRPCLRCKPDEVGRDREADPREDSIRALCDRYGVDAAQAARVEATALSLFDQAEAAWNLDADNRRQLAWAARLHEIGLAIAHSQYHQHGAYLVEHSDIAGFSRTEQQWLAALLRNQRRGLHLPSFDKLPDRLVASVQRCALLLRLAVLMHRSHDSDPLPVVELDVDGDELLLRLPRRWLEGHPLTLLDLEGEREQLAEIGRRLVLKAI